MTYSDSQPYAGIGNLSVDPLFANPATDDYHLKSVRGRWDPALAQWVTDKVHSPCIDKGNPAAAFDQEPVPNRSRTNMGVYGNTPEASKSQAALEGMFAVAAPGRLRRGMGECRSGPLGSMLFTAGYRLDNMSYASPATISSQGLS